MGIGIGRYFKLQYWYTVCDGYWNRPMVQIAVLVYLIVLNRPILQIAVLVYVIVLD